MSDHPDLDGIYDALDAMDPERALQLVDPLLASDADDPELHLLAGVALDGLDRPREAAERFRDALARAPDDVEARVWLAQSLYRGSQFAEAEEQVDRVIELHPELSAAHEIKGLLLERRGDLSEADARFARAVELDPDGSPDPVRLSEAQFGKELSAAIDRLPETFRRCLDDVVIVVEPLPPDALLVHEESTVDPETLGLFDGVPLPERSGGELPPRIFLFQRNLERHCGPELSEQIAITLYHELGHYLGLEEDEVEEIGLG